MERKNIGKGRRQTGSAAAAGEPAAQSSQPSLLREISSPQHAAVAVADPREQTPGSETKTKHSEPRSPTPTMKTESVDTDSASISASISPAPSSASPTAHASPSIPEAKPGMSQLQVALKLLVSNSASGLIIGRSGSTISDLQAKSLTRIKLSQGGDYYPGTSDRVCLIQGPLPNATLAVEMVLGKLYELQSFQQLSCSPPGTATANEQGLSGEKAPTSFIVRLLVPSTCCGMIIGRGGSNIKSLKEKSEVTYIQLSPKEHEVMIGGSTLSTSERIMTITGPNFSSCVNCVQFILSDMAQNPEISRYLNMTTSYSKNLAAVPSSYAVASSPGFFMEHEPFQHQVISQPQLLESPPRYGIGEQFMPGQFSPPSPGSGLQIPGDQSIGLLQQQLMQHQGSAGNYGESIAHGDAPLPVLLDPSTMTQSQQYGQGLISSPPRISDIGQQPSYYQSSQSSQMQFWSPDASSGSPGRSMMSSSGVNIDQLSRSFQGQASIQSHPSHSSLQQLSGSSLASVKFGVADTRIGSILGRGGKTLIEIQSLSQTKIRISQRGEFIPGTQNRVVTITGNTAQDVEHAQQLVNQCLSGSVSRSGSSSELRQAQDG